MASGRKSNLFIALTFGPLVCWLHEMTSGHHSSFFFLGFCFGTAAVLHMKDKPPSDYTKVCFSQEGVAQRTELWLS